MLLALPLIAAAGCMHAPADPAPRPAPKVVTPPPDANPAPPPAADKPSASETTAAPSARSAEIAAFYRKAEADLRARGHLRRDRGAGMTVSREDLVRDFMAIAFHDEPPGSSPVPAPLRRWSEPVRVGLTFGDSVPPAQRIRDRRDVVDLLDRLARASGHSVSLTGETGNIDVFFVSEDERPALRKELARRLPGLPAADLDRILSMPRSLFCAAYAWGRDGRADYAQAVVLIRAEHPTLLRQSCIHEEIAQSMGLAADSYDARPSIFNDDEEFALLTQHDETLLRILYDPRLTPGMNAEQALPIVQTIAAELTGATS
ncbi:DUF2927 domain-containing protein [Paracoccus zhouxuedongae]|uniref:DUF2927 domain-containing protein n=1 Tax=Paracoccus sp. p3-h83 TaxID=3342805 RepID=UPI0035BBE27C